MFILHNRGRAVIIIVPCLETSGWWPPLMEILEEMHPEPYPAAGLSFHPSKSSETHHPAKDLTGNAAGLQVTSLGNGRLTFSHRGLSSHWRPWQQGAHSAQFPPAGLVSGSCTWGRWESAHALPGSCPRFYLSVEREEGFAQLVASSTWELWFWEKDCGKKSQFPATKATWPDNWRKASSYRANSPPHFSGASSLLFFCLA